MSGARPVRAPRGARDVGGTYNDREYQQNRATLLSPAQACIGFPRGIHRAAPVTATTADHRQPISRGGTHALDNLDPLCGSCNSRKAGAREGARGGRDGWRAGS